MTRTGDGKTQEILDWTLLRLITVTFSAEVGVFNKKLKFKVLVSHRSGAVAVLDESRSGVCSLKGQNETAEIKTILRNTPRYSHDSLGHCESAIKEVEKQRVDHKCDSDRHAACTITQRSVNAEEQTSLFKWMSKDYHGEVAKFAELSWFHRLAKQSKLTEQWKDAR